MRLAIHMSHQLALLLFAIVFITVFAVLISDCPSLGQSKGAVRISGFETDIPNLMRVPDGIFIGGQPTPEGLRRLTQFGMKTIINLRPYDETGARDESCEAFNSSMKYFHVPFTATSITKQTIVEFSQLVEDSKNQPVFVHCGSGNRAAGMWFADQVLFQKADKKETLIEARALGLKPELEEKLLKLLSQSDKEK